MGWECVMLSTVVDSIVVERFKYLSEAVLFQQL